jgi:hypothetical protein
MCYQWVEPYIGPTLEDHELFAQGLAQSTPQAQDCRSID